MAQPDSASRLSGPPPGVQSEDLKGRPIPLFCSEQEKELIEKHPEWGWQDIVDQLYSHRIRPHREARIKSVTEIKFPVLEELLTSLELVIRFNGKLVSSGMQNRDEVKSVESLIRDIYRMLELTTYEVCLDLRKKEHENHPLNILWKRWSACSENLKVQVELYLQQTA
jgi:hypothetical protein